MITGFSLAMKQPNKIEITKLIRKHGGKTGEELNAFGK